MTITDDTHTTLDSLRQAVLAFVRERDWLQFHSPKNLSMGIAAEAAELMEHFLWATPEQSHQVLDEPARRQAVREELADVLMFVLEFANVAGIDLSAAVRDKLASNAVKYPVEKSRGSARKYTEL